MGKTSVTIFGMVAGQQATSKRKAQRASRPKVRSGCATCRKRRVKCDEGKPQCLRCMRFGTICGGYNKPSAIQSVPEFSRLLLPKAEGWKTSFPSSLLPGETEIENRYFRHFQDETVSGLAGPFDGTLWTILILQACRHEPFVRHAVVAIGALDKSLQMVYAVSEPSTAKSPPHRDISKMHREFALLQYNKALKTMRGATGKAETNPRNALIACLLVVCFENLLGNRHSALSHAQAGHRLLQNWLNSNPHSLPHESGISSPASHTVEDDLVLTFGKLDLQISSVSDTRDYSEHISLREDCSTTVENIPTTFTNLKQAKLFLDIIMRRAYHFMSCAFILSDSQALSKPFESVPPFNISVPIGTNIHSSTNIISDELRMGQAVYALEIAMWSAAFQPLFHKLQQTVDHTSRIALVLLQIHYLATKIMLDAVTFDNEMSYDQFEANFREMLDLMKSVIYISGNVTQSWHRGTSFELGLTSPLCLIAMKCRHRQLRREAISILRSLPDEGAWELDLIVILGTWIMEVEEEGVVSDVIPETSRAIFTRISEVPKGRVALFQCVQRRGGRDGGPIWKEKLIRW